MTDNDKKTKCRQAEPALPKKARYPKARRAYRRQAPVAKRQTKKPGLIASAIRITSAHSELKQFAPRHDG